MKFLTILPFLFFLNGLCVHSFAQQSGAVTVQVNPHSGNYSVSSSINGWKFSGSIGRAVTNLKNTNGKDAIGTYKMASFKWKNGNEYTAAIRWYDQLPVVVFSLSVSKAIKDQSFTAFPEFTGIPSSLYHFSYHDVDFSTPEFVLNETSTPWLLFDDAKNACVISPASDFIVAKLSGDGNTVIRSGLNEEVKQLPAGFTHSTIMVFGNGIQSTWNTWGASLRSLYQRQRPANDADAILNKYGYWTDNGADYYYNYDTTRGYANTLLQLINHYKESAIPLGYVQLDSWWYEKSIYDPRGNPKVDHKNPKLPSGEWNRYGGLMEYKADPYLFPNGLPSFQEKLGLPMVTHNRWVDPLSPYQKKYTISKFAATDPGYWKEIMDYIKSAGVICYEQDWLNQIYMQSPEMSSSISVGNAFTDGMANASKADGLNMQYCMAMPRHFLQGLKYNNLTTIRTSGDRFDKRRWMPFIFTSQYAYEMGIWPWSDVFKSTETANMILSVLSAGPVGTGDAIGKENKANIMLACRNDGVIVKPDVPIMPVDDDYLQMAANKQLPILGYTYTKHDAITTGYIFAFAITDSSGTQVSFKPVALGFNNDVVVFDPLHNKIQRLKEGETFTDNLPAERYTYYIIAPVTSSGIAFLGDAGKITATGKKRISEISSSGNSLQVSVSFAENESSVTLQGYAERPFTVDNGSLSINPANHLFTVVLKKQPGTDNGIIHFKEK
ncbi:MAG: hypothetical protein JSU05_05605 [Bacteroidetes bacterium]|nr:hypothetical protein [Bacteroidota bacterium]